MTISIICRFKVNVPARLKGCALFGPVDLSSAIYDIFIRVVDNAVGKPCSAFSQQQVLCNDGALVFCVTLADSVRILPGRWYTLEYKVEVRTQLSLIILLCLD